MCLGGGPLDFDIQRNRRGRREATRGTASDDSRDTVNGIERERRVLALIGLRSHPSVGQRACFGLSTIPFASGAKVPTYVTPHVANVASRRRVLSRIFEGAPDSWAGRKPGQPGSSVLRSASYDVYYICVW